MAETQPVLLLTGRKHAGKDAVVVRGLPIRIEERPNETGQTGFIVWDAALALVSYLETRFRGGSPQEIIDLGAGTGLCGIAAAKLFPSSHVTLTDLPELLPQLDHNIGKNPTLQSRIRARALDWDKVRGEDEIVRAAHDLVLASDCVWLREHVEPFARTAEILCASSPGAKLVLSQQRRSEKLETALVRELEDRGFAQVVPPHLASETPTIRVMVMALQRTQT